MLAAPDAIYPQFASHNAFTIAAIHTLAGDGDYEFQCLHGMGESLFDQIVGQDRWGSACRIYAPVGSHETLLAYLVRRLLENGSNSSFVNRIVDPNVRIPLPIALYPDRKNSQGIDFSDESVLQGLDRALAHVPAQFDAKPLFGDSWSATGNERVTITNPCDRRHVVGTVVEATAADVALVREWGVDAVLVGEALVTAPDVAGRVRELAGV